jgi:hypothetical protein
LSEFKSNPDGTILAATEIFDQATGQIVTITAQSNRHDDFITLGVWGIYRSRRARSILSAFFMSSALIPSLNPLAGGAVTGPWDTAFGTQTEHRPSQN